MSLKYKHLVMSLNRSRDTKSRKNMGSRGKAVFLSLLIFVSVITTLPVLQPSVANAANRADSNSSNADWQIKSMLYYKAIARCLGAGAFNYSSYWPWDNQDISASNVNSGKWFNNSSSGQPVGIYLKGSLNGVDEEGKVKCGDGALISSALSLWGLSATDVICHSGFRGVDLGSNQSTETCQRGTKFELASDGSTSVDNEGLFKSYIRDQVYGGNEPNLSGAQNYVYYRHTLNQSCIQGIDNSGNQPSGTPVSSDNKYGYNDVKWVDSVNKSIITGSYIGNLKTDSKVTISATDSGRDSSIGVQKTCSEIVNLMNQHANDFLQLINTNIKAAEDAVATGNKSGDSDSESASSCSIEGIGWIVCPVVNFLAKIADGAFKYLADNFLSTSPAIVSTDSDTYRAWTIMRSIANVAFVIVFLIIIFSQITSVGISNYGIKKLLPRIIIAAILVNVSYFICQIAIDLSNIIGYSLQSLLANLVPTSAGDSGTWSGGTLWAKTAGGIIAVGATAAIAWASLAALIPVLLAAVVALIMVLFILVARQALIILLVVLSPLAFVAFLLPNTSDWFKKWQKAFTAMLILFPVIALVLGSSRFASGILHDVFSANESAGTSTSGLGQIVSAAILVLPLFIIPGLLKKSLDGVGSIGAKMNGWSDKWGKAAGDKYTGSAFNKYRQGLATDKSSRISSGNYRGSGGSFNPNNWRSGLNRRLNKSGTFNTVTGGFGAHRDLAAQAQDFKDTKDAQAMFGGDDGLMTAWATTGGDISKLKPGELTNIQLGQFDRLRRAGHQNKATSFLAAVQALSESGKGNASVIESALSNASKSGASDIDIAGARGGARAAYRKSGRGDVFADLSEAVTTKPMEQAIGWSQVSAETISKDGIDPDKNPAGAASFAQYLQGAPENTRLALVGYDKMNPATQSLARDKIIEAAQKHRPEKTITTIQEAKEAFGA